MEDGPRSTWGAEEGAGGARPSHLRMAEPPPGVSLGPEPPAGYLKLERPVATLCIFLPQNHHPK